MNTNTNKEKPSATKEVPPVLCQSDTSTCSIESLHELIRKRAYEFYEARGGQPGGELEDWLRAECEVNHHFGI